MAAIAGLDDKKESNQIGYQPCQRLPEFFLVPASATEFDRIDVHLAKEGPTTTLFFVLRISDSMTSDTSRFERGSYWFSDALHRSFFERIRPIRDAWHGVIGDRNVWSGLLEFRNIHVFGVRGPTSKIREFINLDQIRNGASPLAGFIRPFRVHIPEQAIDWSVLDDVEPSFGRQLESVDSWFRGLTSQKEGLRVEEVAKLLERQEVVAALDLYQRIVKFLPWLRVSYIADAVRRVLNRFSVTARENSEFRSSQWNYLDSLGIGNLSRFGDDAGAGQKVIVLDSGADESSPFLQRQIVDYLRVDGSAQMKNAHDCVDIACHGTKMASVIAGRGVTLHDLGFTESFVTDHLGQKLSEFGLVESDILRPGIAPSARLGICEVLRGDLFGEGGGAPEILAGLDWAASLNLSGYGVLNVSIEVDADQFNEKDKTTFDRLFDLIKMQGIVPVLAAGNHGAKSLPISTQGLVVGAADESDHSVAANGPIVHVLARGQNVVCGQPRLNRLKGVIPAVHSGSSFAAAIVSGSIAVLATKHGVSTSKAADALERSSNGGVISLDRASQLL